MGRTSSLMTPLLIIAMGVGWLLTTMKVLPAVNWVWVLALGMVGLLVLILGGINKLTVVVGPFLILATIFSLLRQTGRLTLDIEVPSLVIAAGVLMLIARLPIIPPPHWLNEKSE